MVKKSAQSTQSGKAIVRPGVKAPQHPAPVLYKGAIPVKGFIGWIILVLVTVFCVGFLAVQLLVSQRTSQLVQETSSRVQLQAQGRSAVISEWVKGLTQIGNNMANSETIRLYVYEKQNTNKEGGDEALAKALESQTPYVSEALKDFSIKNKLLGAAILGADGSKMLEWGKSFSGYGALVGNIKVLPLQLTKDGVVMGMAIPIKAPSTDDAMAKNAGFLTFSLSVGDVLSNLVAATPLDRQGERTALIQYNSDRASVVGRTGLSALQEPYKSLEERMSGGKLVQKSVVDGKDVFATLKPVSGAPFAVLQEYSAKDALAVLDLYKPGLYLIVGLLIVVLGAMMMALTLHLMAQRNKTRVKLLGQTMEALVRVVESRDPFLAGHHARVARLSVQVGNMMNMGVGERATLYYAAQLSSVGRLLVPRQVLSKKSKLTASERKDLETHISQALSILGELDFDLPIVPVIAQMYEREDGSGHPAGLHANQISPMAKVLGACDAYVALTSQRAHRKALDRKEALKAMQGGVFAKDIVQAIGKIEGKAV